MNAPFFFDYATVSNDGQMLIVQSMGQEMQQ
jgi:hypothetical protein